MQPLKPFTLGGEGWGAWEVAARVSQLKLDGDTFPLFASEGTNAREALSYSFGLNWHLNRNVKFNLNYEHTDFDGGEDNALLADGEDVIRSCAMWCCSRSMVGRLALLGTPRKWILRRVFLTR